MTSAKAIAANRINGRKSRGPRTQTGRRRASCNALRHGLSAASHRNPALLEQMARVICDGDPNPSLFAQAMVIAENEMLLRCINDERTALIERLRGPITIERAKSGVGVAVAKVSDEPTWTDGRPKDGYKAMHEAIPGLERILRYERRAWSRRKRAISMFIAIKLTDPPG